MKILVLAILCVVASVNAAKLDSPSSAIINGNDVANVMPAYAYLEIYQLAGLQGDIFFGGATLISNQAVITVAQNVVGFGSFRCGLGGYRIRDLTWINVQSAHPHPQYNPATLGNNIAVLRLVTPITISERIHFFGRLPPISPFPQDPSQLTIVGFGFGETDNQPEILQEAVLTTLLQTECGNWFPHLVTNQQLDNYFCASNTTTRANICAGDQGGPIYDRGLGVLIGVQSFNRRAECGDLESQPAAFVRVNRYDDFITPLL